MDGVVNHRDWITATFTQISSFFFTLPYPLFFLNFVIQGWLYHFPLQIASLGGALSLPEELISLLVVSPSYPVLPRLPFLGLTKCFDVKQPGFVPVHPPKYTLGLTLQNPCPLHTGLVPPRAA